MGIVIVTYEPGPIIGPVLDAAAADRDTPVVIVDNSRQPSTYLQQAIRAHPHVRLFSRPENLGFCAGNNLGLRELPMTEYVLFLNPDAVVGPHFVDQAAATLDARPDAGALNPKLVRLDEQSLQPTGEIDSAGVFVTWYGRPYDRGQGQRDDGRFAGNLVEVPALCGAAMFCRRQALDRVAPDGEVFDESFFMYKEDVDLSYRLRRNNWTLLYAPDLVVGHVRGLRAALADRDRMRRVRLQSLENDWRLWRKRDLPGRMVLPMLGYLAMKSVWTRLRAG